MKNKISYLSLLCSNLRLKKIIKQKQQTIYFLSKKVYIYAKKIENLEEEIKVLNDFRLDDLK